MHSAVVISTSMVRGCVTTPPSDDAGVLRGGCEELLSLISMESFWGSPPGMAKRSLRASRAELVGLLSSLVLSIGFRVGKNA